MHEIGSAGVSKFLRPVTLPAARLVALLESQKAYPRKKDLPIVLSNKLMIA